MTTLLIDLLTLAVVILGFAALIRLTRHDAFAGPGTGHLERDELGSLAFRRRAA